MDQRELSDKYILDAMRRGHGNVAFDVPGFGVFQIAKGRDERPFEFIQRVRREYGAWYAEQDYQANRKARDLQDRAREEDHRPAVGGANPSVDVQAVEASLAEIIQAKVNGLRTRRENLESVRARAYQEATSLALSIANIDREIERALKVLKELEEEDAPEVHQTTSPDIREQVGQGEPSGGDGLGAESSEQVVRQEGQGPDTGDSD